MTHILIPTDAIKADSPWFFNLRALIAARPNLQPVGLGNNETDFDVDLLLRSHDGDDMSSAPDDTQDLPIQLDDPTIDVSSDSDGELLTIPTLANSVKHKREDDPLPPRTEPKPVKKKTKPQPATSTPATSVVVPKKSTTANDRFSATILAEEETAQKQLVLKPEAGEDNSS